LELPFNTEIYGETHPCVPYSGRRFEDNYELDFFLTRVYAKLADLEGKRQFKTFLEGLRLTGYGTEKLEEFLRPNPKEERKWAISEALCETYLEEEEKVKIPWNTLRDKKNFASSLPGADIVGLKQNGNQWLLVVGEVKSSSEESVPPQVMRISKKQLEYLALKPDAIQLLFKWLFYRVKNTALYPYFEQAMVTFLESGSKAVALYGMLVRDTEANEKDLSSVGIALREKISLPMTCHSIAIYLPWSLDRLPQKINIGGAQ